MSTITALGAGDDPGGRGDPRRAAGPPTLSFRVPAGPPTVLADALRRASLSYGHDRAPSPTRRDFQDPNLVLSRDIQESSPAFIPWDVPGTGRLMAPTTTLMLRERPYHLLPELVRGKLNEVRNQYADWQGGGLTSAADVDDLIRRATHAFGQALLDLPAAAADRKADEALGWSFAAADRLVRLYEEQVFRLRHQRQAKFDTALGCRLTTPPAKGLSDQIRAAFNAVCVPLTWRGIEPVETNYKWEDADAVIRWANDQGLRVFGGPLIDFSPGGLPDYVLRGDLDSMTFRSLMCDYVETVVGRYRGAVSRWVVATGANGSNALGFSEEELIRLTAMAADAAWQIDPNLQIVFGLSRPWSDFLADPGFESSAFVFADTLLRANLPFAGIELEVFCGTGPRGSYCRDLLDVSRQLDLFGLLGVPVQVSLGYPASKAPDPKAGPDESAGDYGHWRDISAAAQADWATGFGGLSLCKSYVTGVFWDHLSDAEPHRLANAGLIDSRGMIRPALDRLRALREEHLK